jgi:hypothetical protein
MPQTTTEMFAQRPMSGTIIKPVPMPSYEIPRGKKSGGLYVLDQNALAKATKSTALNKLVTLGSEPFHLPTNRSKLQCLKSLSRQTESNKVLASLPFYTNRQSVRELKKIGADNKKAFAKLSLSKPSVAKALKTRAYGSPSALKREASESEDYTDSSDDSSEYTSDEEDEPSPLPPARPEEPHEAVRYDIIKATWHPRRSPLSSEKIKASMRDIWEVLNTIQKRWRADSKAVTDAEDAKKTGELPVLKSRVTSQRDLLQSALKAALQYAHPDVLYQLGQIKPFVYLCYQFLANRFRMKDFDGPLPAVIYEVLARCGTLTSELLEETKIIKALVSMKKQANDKHKAFIQEIIDGAAANSKKAQVSTPPTTEPTEPKGAKRPAPEPAARTSGEGPATKKPKPAEGPANTVKKTVVAPTGSKGPIIPNAAPQLKKPTTAPVPVKARVSQVANKPSGLFASLNAASKKPTPAAAAPAVTKANGLAKSVSAAVKDKKPAAASAKPAFSFAQTMASLLKPKEPEVVPVKTEKQLPPETPEEKTKRLRKEARRHLRVTFKPDTALCQIKYFSHDPDEELGHDENFVRHAGDIGGEGAMFKQHKELDVDDDDDDEPEMEDKPWREPSQVDFGALPPMARQSNYAPYGGGQQTPACPEIEANVRRENATLMVFYADLKDIPSSPREPLEQDQDSAPAVTVTNFGTPPEHVLTKGPQSLALAPVAMPDLSNLENIFKQFAMPVPTQAPAMPQPEPIPQTAYPPPPPMPTGVPDLQSILSALQGPAASQAQAPVPAPAAFPMPPAGQQFPPPPMDFTAIMSAISASAGSGMALPPPPPGFPPFPFALPGMPQQAEGAAYQPPQQPQYSPQDYNAQDYNSQANGGTKRQREDASNNDRGQGKKHKHRGERPHKVLPCKFFQLGKCNKGDNCTYVHDLNM